jgi:bifunctional UDP-N-acetylglucosamine pyrophosphorylase/glucosamine-1-phosphate N-acetyltransferase
MMTMHTYTASIIMAAGRGSRMKGYEGNKTLLPLIAGQTIFEGERTLLRHIMENLPEGPKALVVNHCKDAVIAATRDLDPVYCHQPLLNGTGGAILAAAEFVNQQPCEHLIITMGDVPFVKKETYRSLVQGLATSELVVLGFRPTDKKQYGVLEIESGRVRKITEWKFWKDYPAQRQAALTICNSGIYAVKKHILDRYLPIMADRPHIVHKEINGKMTPIEEFFITDLIEYLVEDGLPVSYRVTENETETMGIDDRKALEKAQAIYLVNIQK